MKVLALLALAACSSAKPLWVYPYSPAFAPTVLNAVPAANCRESFQKIETKFCEPTFEIVCNRYKQPSQTIDLKRECVEVPSVVCGTHKHNDDDQGWVHQSRPFDFISVQAGFHNFNLEKSAKIRIQFQTQIQPI